MGTLPTRELYSFVSVFSERCSATRALSRSPGGRRGCGRARQAWRGYSKRGSLRFLPRAIVQQRSRGCMQTSSCQTPNEQPSYLANSFERGDAEARRKDLDRRLANCVLDRTIAIHWPDLPILLSGS